MFDNVASKLKTSANVLFILGVIGSVIWAIILFDDYDPEMNGIVALILGIATSWFSSLLIYGFGHLIENTDKLVGKQNPSSSKSHVVLPPPSGDYLKKAGGKTTTNKCPYCGDIVKNGRCEMCGKEVKF